MEKSSKFKCEEIEGLAHIAIFTPNIEESISFYTEKLGFTFRYSKEIPSPIGTTKLVLIEKGSCVLELVQPADLNEASERTEGIIAHIALQVKGIENLVKKLRSMDIDSFESEDIKFSSGHYNGAKIMFFRGPSGERIELFEYI